MFSQSAADPGSGRPEQGSPITRTTKRAVHRPTNLARRPVSRSLLGAGATAQVCRQTAATPEPRSGRFSGALGQTSCHDACGPGKYGHPCSGKGVPSSRQHDPDPRCMSRSGRPHSDRCGREASTAEGAQGRAGEAGHLLIPLSELHPQGPALSRTICATQFLALERCSAPGVSDHYSRWRWTSSPADVSPLRRRPPYPRGRRSRLPYQPDDGAIHHGPTRVSHLEPWVAGGPVPSRRMPAYQPAQNDTEGAILALWSGGGSGAGKGYIPFGSEPVPSTRWA
jgi:hypothetical protein